MIFSEAMEFVQKAEVGFSLEEIRSKIIPLDSLDQVSVDFSRYSSIIAAVHEKEEHFWMSGKIDADLVNHAMRKFDAQTGKEFVIRFQSLIEEFTIRL